MLCFHGKKKWLRDTTAQPFSWRHLYFLKTNFADKDLKKYSWHDITKARLKLQASLDAL